MKRYYLQMSTFQDIDDALKTACINFSALVQKLLNAPLEKEIFFQVSILATLKFCDDNLIPESFHTGGVSHNI